MRWFRSSASAVVLACCITVCLSGVARADDDAPKPAPRTAIHIGGASIVLIAANDHLYAFVDRTEDNTPLDNAELDIDSADGPSLDVSKASECLYVAPFNRAGHMHDAFMVSLRSPEVTGDAPAEIASDDLPDSAGGDAGSGLASKIYIALVAAGIGAIASALLMRWLTGRRKRTASQPVGTAHAA